MPMQRETDRQGIVSKWVAEANAATFGKPIWTLMFTDVQDVRSVYFHVFPTSTRVILIFQVCPEYLNWFEAEKEIFSHDQVDDGSCAYISPLTIGETHGNGNYDLDCFVLFPVASAFSWRNMKKQHWQKTVVAWHLLTFHYILYIVCSNKCWRSK